MIRFGINDADEARLIKAGMKPAFVRRIRAITDALWLDISTTSIIDPPQPKPGHCKRCGTKLHSKEILSDSRCVGCRHREKAIGPERPKG